MGGGYRAAPMAGDSVAPIVQAIKATRKRLDEVERPTGTSYVSLVEQVQQALANITTTVTAAIAANSYTKVEIDSKDSAVYANAVADTEAWVTAGFTATGGISAADLYTRNGPGVNITATRVAGWLQSSDGRIGTATSSERFKTDIRPVPFDELRSVLEVEIDYFSYIAEVRKRDDPSFEGYAGPDYHVAVNIGVIAERLHEAGLWQFVIYERDENDALKLDDEGEPTPFGVHDILLAYAVIPVVQDHERRIAALEMRMDSQNGAS